MKRTVSVLILLVALILQTLAQETPRLGKDQVTKYNLLMIYKAPFFFPQGGTDLNNIFQFDKSK